MLSLQNQASSSTKFQRTKQNLLTTKCKQFFVRLRSKTSILKQYLHVNCKKTTSGITCKYR